MKTVQNVKNSLKFKAAEKTGVLSLKIGVKKYTIPVAARMVSGDGYLFLSFPASSELYHVSKTELTPLGKDEDATAAYEKLNKAGRRGRQKRSASAELSDELKAALATIPAGHKLVYQADGSARLVKTRTRRKKA